MTHQARRIYWLTMLRLGKERRFVEGNGCASCAAHVTKWCALCRLASLLRWKCWGDGWIERDERGKLRAIEVLA